MSEYYLDNNIDWNPILQQMQVGPGQDFPTFPGDLKAALVSHAGLNNDAVDEAAYQLAVEIAQTSTECDPEITYWFSRLVSLLRLQSQLHSIPRFGLPIYLKSVSSQS